MDTPTTSAPPLPGLELPPPEAVGDWDHDGGHARAWLAYENLNGECCYCGIGRTKRAAYANLIESSDLDDSVEYREEVRFRHLCDGLTQVKPGGHNEAYDLMVLTGPPLQHGYCDDLDTRIHDAEDLALALLEADPQASYGFWNTGENEFKKRRLLYDVEALRELGPRLFPDLWDEAQRLLAERSKP